MSLDVACGWIQKTLTDPDVKFATIYLFGGEPLLQFELLKQICEWTWSKIWSVKYKFLVQTNGTLLDSEKKSWFIANKKKIFVSLSIDGGRVTHNANRDNSFDKIDLNFFLQNWPNQPAKMTIDVNNVSRIKRDIIFLQKKGFVLRGCNFAIGQGGIAETALQEVVVQLKLLANYYIKHPDMPIAPIIDLPLHLCESRNANRPFCKIGTNQLMVVNVDGTISPCSFFASTSLHEEKRAELEDEIKSIAVGKIYCAHSCFFFPICGMCYGENYYATGNIYQPPSYQCSITKVRVAASAYLQAHLLSKKPQDEITQIDQTTIRAINKILSNNNYLQL